MADAPSSALTPEQAKARLRQAAQKLTPSAALERHPWSLLAVALISGYAAGRGKFSPVLNQPWVVSLIVRSLGRWALTCSHGKGEEEQT